MAETTKPVPPVGRIRWVAGFILLGLGLLLVGRLLWLVLDHGQDFPPEDWLRFGIALWTGAAIALAGYWLTYRSRVAMWCTVLMIVGWLPFAFALISWLKRG